MNSFIEKRLAALVPVFVQPVEGLPPADPDEIVSFIEEFLAASLPEFRPLYYGLVMALYGLCRLRRGRALGHLSPEEAVGFLESLYGSRFAAVRAIPSVLAMPIYMAHYDRDDIQPKLGFDTESMRREAAERGVER